MKRVFCVCAVCLMGSAALADSPAATRPEGLPAARVGHWWEAQPGWSAPVQGLSVQIDAGNTLSKRLGLEVGLHFWNVGGGSFSVDLASGADMAWDVRNAKGEVVAPKAVKAEARKPGWYTYAAGASTPGTIVSPPDANRDGVLKIGTKEWHLEPGDYTLQCLFKGMGEAPAPRPAAWAGTVDVPAHPFTVFADPTAKELTDAAAKVRADHAADKGIDLYAALAKLVAPGMTYEQLQVVLPPMKEAGMPTSMMMWNGNIFTSWYPLDKDHRVEATGIGVKDDKGEVALVLTSTPRIIGAK